MTDSGSRTIFTIGHSNRTLEAFVGMLRKNDISCLIDVRKIPRSGHNPQFNRESLPQSLTSEHIVYRHLSGLGGLRRPMPDSPNLGWRNESFRAFADYMQTPEFTESIDQLTQLAHQRQIAVMCAEAVPWRCHRSLIADALVVRGYSVVNILSMTRNSLHILTPFAHVDGLRITYPPSAADIPLF